MIADHLNWWNDLRHGGLLLDSQRLSKLVPHPPAPLDIYEQGRFRRRLQRFRDDARAHRGELVAHALQYCCGFSGVSGTWSRGSEVPATWSRRAITGESVRPRHLWLGPNGAILPVFIDDQPRLGVGRGHRIISQTLQWLRQGQEQLALVTNGQQWRLVFAGLDYDAFCEWDIDLWLTEGEPSAQFQGFRSLLDPALWTPPATGERCQILVSINDSRRGQSDLSQILGERVRQAVELLVQGHAPALVGIRDTVSSPEIYRAAVRVVMRMVVVLFAESREGLLPRDNPVFYTSYSLQGLRERLEQVSPYQLRSNYAAWFRVLAMFRMVFEGSSHEALLVPAYGGELFAPGDPNSADGMQRALHVFETGAFHHDVMTDAQVQEILVKLTRTRVRLRQGRSNVMTTVPVDFCSLDSEYIGILYEGLLDFELKIAPPDQPVIFLAVGNQPALPLATLEAMDDAAIRNLLEKMKDTSSGDDEEEDEESAEEEAEAEDEDTGEEDADEEPLADEEPVDDSAAAVIAPDDVQYTTRARAEAWAVRACTVGGLVRRPRGRLTPERQMAHDAEIARKARQIIPRVVQPGEWYLARWGGTRKGSGTFYTRPQLAVPTVHRTLRPLAYDPPAGSDGQPDIDAPLEAWTPKPPERILALKVCDPACGSGTFPLAALRFLTQALYASLEHHGRIRESQGRSILSLIRNTSGTQALAEEALPCRPDDDSFEPRTRAILRRYVVERCIYGIDFDPLAVELCRLSLWIETLDRRLPFTFIDHKIKTGNALVGAWFDQFLHYPIMAWSREGGDKSHSNGVNFEEEAWTQVIKDFKNEAKHDLKQFIDGGRLSFSMNLSQVKTVHDAAEAALRAIHDLGIEKAAERAVRYSELRSSPEFTNLKDAFDLWCSLWFWPTDQLEHAPLPTEFASGQLAEETLAIVRDVARQRRFFHWELEFPDVFSTTSQGFHAILGNPPWEISKPNSKEFFSSIDPLYRSYGKEAARLEHQPRYFRGDSEIEANWIRYKAYFNSLSNWVKYAGSPFGDRISVDSNGKESFDCKLGDGGVHSFATSQRRHARWKLKREESSGYADADHAFRHQGSADVNLYKLFVEQAHALLAEEGRLGLIIPSGLYCDFGTGDLRRLFIDQCRWEWLFGFENRDKIFDIHRSFKFNPVIVTKGGQTESIRTVFMRRSLADWERAEQLATPYAREQIDQFSPLSRAILEIQSRRDLEILTKIYANSVLLGDQSERGWGIRYNREFDMTNDAKLFPPRPKWEEWGYRPDEYSRWIKGPWKPIDELWAVLGVDPARPVPIDEACRGEIDAGIASGDVGRTVWRVRCAQPPYDTLPIPRADIPPGVILSREADAWLREDEIPVVTFTEANGRPLRIKTGRSRNAEAVEVRGPAIALPLYQGKMIWQFEFSKATHTGSNGNAAWTAPEVENKRVLGQFLMCDALASDAWRRGVPRICFRDVQNATNQRTFIATLLPAFPNGNKVPTLTPESEVRLETIVAKMVSFPADRAIRLKMSQGTINWFIAAEVPMPATDRSPDADRKLAKLAAGLCCGSQLFASYTLRTTEYSETVSWKSTWAIAESERLRLRSMCDAITAGLCSLSYDDYRFLQKETDYPAELVSSKSFARNLDLKGFWRVDKTLPPECRHTILSLVAFHDLLEKISDCDDDLVRGIEAFCNQNDAEGWMLPETLRLVDYGLGHDDRAQEPQPVRARFGPRFYDWQLAQSAEESWRECHLHARNLLGEAGYQSLLDELAGPPPQASLPPRNQPPVSHTQAEGSATSQHGREHQPGLFHFDDELPFSE